MHLEQDASALGADRSVRRAGRPAHECPFGERAEGRSLPDAVDIDGEQESRSTSRHDEFRTLEAGFAAAVGSWPGSVEKGRREPGHGEDWLSINAQTSSRTGATLTNADRARTGRARLPTIIA